MGVYINYPYKNKDGEQYQFSGEDPYSFSNNLNKELKDSNVTDIVSNPGYKEPEVTIEELKQLLIFIRNFDSDGNLIETPINAISTKIDIYERKVDRYYWYQPKTNDDGTIDIDNTEFKEKFIIKEDPTAFIEDEIKSVNPHIIHDTTYLSSFFRDYYNNYKEIAGINNKKLELVIHNSTDEYEFYDTTFDSELLNIFIQHNYYKLDFDLDKHSFIIDKNEVYEFGSFTLRNAKLVLSSKPGFTLKTDNLLMDSVEIDVQTPTTPYISITYRESVKLNYISFIDKIAYFDIAGKEENAIRWLSQSVTIFGFSVDTPTINYEDVLEYILKIKNTNTVTVTGFTMRVAKFKMGAMRFQNCLNLTMNTCNLGSTDRFEKSLVSIESVSNISVCSCYAAQDRPQNEKSYFFTMTKGDTLNSHSFVSVITTNFGLLSLIEDYSEKISLYSCKSEGSIHPLNYQSSSVQKITISKSVMTNIKEFEISPNSIAIFDSELQSESLNISAIEKIFVSNSTLKGKKTNIIAHDETNIFLEGSLISGNDIIINGNGASSIFKMKDMKISSSSLDVQSLKKGSVENTSIEVEEFSLSGLSISGFNPSFEGNKIKKINLSGKIANSIFLLNDKFARPISITENDISGNVGFVFVNNLYETNINLKNANVITVFDTMENSESEINVNLICEEDCKKSIIYSLNDRIHISPKAEGSFNDLKLIDSSLSLNELKRSKIYNDKIAYGRIAN